MNKGEIITVLLLVITTVQGIDKDVLKEGLLQKDQHNGYDYKISPILESYIKRYIELTQELNKSKKKDSLEEYLQGEPAKSNDKANPHRSKRAASYNRYSRYKSYSPEPVGYGTNSARNSYSPINSNRYSGRSSSYGGRSYNGANSYYSPSRTDSGRNLGGRSYYGPQSQYGGSNTAYTGAAQSSHGGGGYGSYPSGRYGGASTGYGGASTGYGESYAPAPSGTGYAADGYSGGGYGGGSYADPTYGAQSGGYGSDPNDPYSAYPDEALTKYLEEILQKSSSSSEEDSGSRSRGRAKNASPESRDASDKKSDSDESNSNESENSSDESDRKSKKKSKKKSRKSKKRGRKSKSESDSSQEYDYSEEVLPSLTPTKSVGLSKVPFTTQAPQWIGTTPSTRNGVSGLNTVVSQEQASLLFNNLLGNLLQTAIKNQPNKGLNLESTTTSTLPPMIKTTMAASRKNELGEELAELGFLIKSTFRKMASRLDSLKVKQESLRGVTKKDSPQNEPFENSRGNAYINLPSPKDFADRTSGGKYVSSAKSVYKLPEIGPFRGTTTSDTLKWQN